MGTHVLQQRSVMEQLRAATAQQHASLDHDSRIANKFTSHSGLALLLGRWYGFFATYEEKLAAVSPTWANLLHTRSKTPSLLTDLSTHGLDPSHQVLCDSLPPINNDAEMFGAMYVTEGSTLGGRYIARQLEQGLGLSNGRGYSFFLGYGERNGSMWHEFGSIVNEVCAEAPEKAICAARQTFECIHRWLGTE